MTSRDVLAIAAHGLETHPLRTTLSSIGIVFGVATVVAALGVGKGARREATEQFGSLGINNVFVRSVTAKSPAARTQPAPALTLADVEALRGGISSAAAISAVRSHRLDMSAGHARQESTLVGVQPEYAHVAELRVETGRWLVADDVRTRRRVMVLGDALARELFGQRPAVGEHVSAGRDGDQVVGVLAPRGRKAQAPPAAQRFDIDRVALVPLPAMDARLGAGDAIDRVEEIGVRASGAEQVQATAVAVAAILDRRYPRDAAYEIVVPRELLRARLHALRTFNVVLFSIGGLALLISGIGIMNIMLASVAERTAEIGVRRAFGATRRMIVAQFTAEASLLCGCGGVAGVILGFGLAQSIALLAAWPVAVSLAGVTIAVAMSVIVGLGFGIYPAYLAGSLDPADALRAP